MCVYNGARFLRQQLDSIAAQSEFPRRLVVVDDGSNDGSWELLEHWASSVPFEVILKRNDCNLGVVRNFQRAISLIDQDIVFLADQDDVWYPGKLATFVDRFVEDPEVGLLHSDADLIDGEGRPLDRRLFDTLLVTEDEKQEVAAGKAYRAYAKRNLVTGAACAFRRELLAQALPLSTEWIHDEWIAFTAALVSKVVLLDAPTMAYRLHSQNTVGLPLPTLLWRVNSVLRAMVEPQRERQAKRAERLRELHDHALRIGGSPEAIACIDAALAHATFRSTLPRHTLKRALLVRAEWHRGQYRAWSSGRSSAVHDLLLPN